MKDTARTYIRICIRIHVYIRILVGANITQHTRIYVFIHVYTYLRILVGANMKDTPRTRKDTPRTKTHHARAHMARAHQVERFVKMTGGGHGVYFGENNIFALGPPPTPPPPPPQKKKTLHPLSCSLRFAQRGKTGRKPDNKCEKGSFPSLSPFLNLCPPASSATFRNRSLLKE